MYDFERGAKTTGAKFYFNTAKTALGEWRLINDAIAYYTMRGYEFVIPPFLVNRKTAEDAGILPRFAGDFYEVNDFDGNVGIWDRIRAVFNPDILAARNNLLLVPTAEIPLVGMHGDEIFNEADLPRRYVAITPCFRREAGARGKRDKGMKRVHQFFKVELFVITTPDQAEAEYKRLVVVITGFLDSLGIKDPKNGNLIKMQQRELDEYERAPTALKTIDIEADIEGEWVEIASISNTGDNQAKPALVRYRPKTSTKTGKDRLKPQKCVLLNGTGLALPRVMLAMYGEGGEEAWAGPSKAEEVDQVLDKILQNAAIMINDNSGADLEAVYQYVEPGDDDEPVYVTRTGKEIIEEYFPFWQGEVTRVRKEEAPGIINFKNCIDDWVAMHWAQRIG